VFSANVVHINESHKIKKRKNTEIKFKKKKLG